MPRPKITGRGTSINAVFVQAIIPRQVDAAAQGNLYELAGIDPLRCVYCGAARTDTDHLRPIVKAGRPSGFFHVTGNLVPACGTCNQSKSGLEWRSWITSTTAKKSPVNRTVPDLDERIGRLELFEELAGLTEPTNTDVLREAAGAELWDAYWKKCADIYALMQVAQSEAEKIEIKLTEWHNAQQLE